MLVIGIIYHAQFMFGLRKVRRSMHDETLVHAESNFPVSFTLLVAVLLLAIGLIALVSLTFQVGPFH
jgi:putative membrane protein